MISKFGRSILSIITVLALLVSVAVSAAPTEQGMSGHWAAESLNKWQEAKLLKGNQEGELEPNRSITRAEFIALVNRVFNYQRASKSVFSDVESDKWYAVEFAKAFEAGIIKGDGNGRMNPLSLITREEAAVVLAEAFAITTGDSKAYASFADGPKVALWARAAVSALKEQNYIKGRAGNLFAPAALITRAEAVVMIDNIMGDLHQEEGMYKKQSKGNAVVNIGEVVLADSTVGGTLYLTPGIGDGDATLQGMTIEGDVRAAGGGENSVLIKDSRINGMLMINRQHGNVRVVLAGTASANEIVIQNGGTLVNESAHPMEVVRVTGPISKDRKVIIVGKMKKLIIEGDVSIELKDAIVEQLEIAEGASTAFLTVVKGSIIQKAVFNGKSSVTGEGKIELAEVNSSGVELAMQPGKLVLKQGLTVLINGIVVDKSTDNGPIWTGGGSTEPAVGSVSIHAFDGAEVPQQLKDYHLVLIGEKTLDYTITLQPSIFPVADGEVKASALDKAGKVWVATGDTLKRFDVYERDESKVQTYEKGKHFQGEIKALLAAGDYMWVLTDTSVAKIRYQ